MLQVSLNCQWNRNEDQVNLGIGDNQRLCERGLQASQALKDELDFHERGNGDLKEKKLHKHEMKTGERTWSSQLGAWSIQSGMKLRGKGILDHDRC